MSRSPAPRATRRTLAGATAAVLAVAVALTLVLAGGDDSAAGGKEGPLVWEATPRVVAHPTLPDDRILTGKVRNESLETVEIRAGDLRLRDGDGTTVDGVGIFLEAFLHPVLPPGGEAELPPSELARQGRVLKLPPGETAPVTVAWRQPAGTDAPTRLEYDRGRLRVPAAR